MSRNNKTVKVTIEFEVIVPKLIEAVGMKKAKKVVRDKLVKYCKDVNKRIKRIDRKIFTKNEKLHKPDTPDTPKKYRHKYDDAPRLGEDW